MLHNTKVTVKNAEGTFEIEEKKLINKYLMMDCPMSGMTSATNYSSLKLRNKGYP